MKSKSYRYLVKRGRNSSHENPITGTILPIGIGIAPGKKPARPSSILQPAFIYIIRALSQQTIENPREQQQCGRSTWSLDYHRIPRNISHGRFVTSTMTPSRQACLPALDSEYGGRPKQINEAENEVRLTTQLGSINDGTRRGEDESGCTYGTPWHNRSR
ncbi:hypothetical protein KM043_016735 [Ampulex compressa]|nr:hypothetical protein KM043_016735 [Ampulex compressa]